jgi:hypothetical protein
VTHVRHEISAILRKQCGGYEIGQAKFTGVKQTVRTKLYICNQARIYLKDIEITNEWRHTSTLFVCLHAVDRDKFTLPLQLGNNSDD